MMGRSHALSGWCAGLAVAPLIGLTSVAQVVPFAAATAGYALVPDLDHPGASASRLLGPVTCLVSGVVRAFSGVLYTLTKGVASLSSGSLGQGSQYPIKLAAAAVMTIPVAIVFLIFQKRIMNSSTGAVKE